MDMQGRARIRGSNLIKYVRIYVTALITFTNQDIAIIEMYKYAWLEHPSWMINVHKVSLFVHVIL